jgi:mercuric ion transport protein
MKDRALLRAGIAGTALAAVCCLTPALVLLLGAVGLSAWLGWLDYVLLPAMVGFAGLTVYALYRRRHADACSAPDELDRAKEAP